jgi:glycerophosphoryl diester phosphodiesterase
MRTERLLSRVFTRDSATVLVAIAAGLPVAGIPITAAPPADHPSVVMTAPRRPASHPLVIAHRGASGYRPEHTLASYSLAIRMGADYIEPDLVPTRDGVLVARHENEIGGTTDVSRHPEFADRRTTKIIDGTAKTGWFTEDFTLRELRTLRATERLPGIRPANARFDGRYQIPTFDEILDLARRAGKRYHRTIGVYPETKHPGYFARLGLPLEPPLLRALRRHGMDRADAPVFIQSFEPGNLRRLAGQTPVRLIQLIDAAGHPYGDPRPYADLVTPAGLATIARYADGVGLNTGLIIPLDAAGRPGRVTSVVQDAHAAGLEVHAWTLRRENSFLPAPYRLGTDPAGVGDAGSWFAAVLATGVDGVFSDNPDVALAAVRGIARAA